MRLWRHPCMVLILSSALTCALCRAAGPDPRPGTKGRSWFGTGTSPTSPFHGDPVRSHGDAETKLASSMRIEQVAARIEDEPTTTDNFYVRWNLMRRWIVKVPQKERAGLFSYAEVVNVKVVYFSDKEKACRRLDLFYAKAAAALRRGQTARPGPPPVAAEVRAGLSEKVLRMADRIEKEPTTKDTFFNRWNLINRWIMKVPREERASLFSYAQVINTKVVYFSDKEKACRRLDLYYAKAAARLGAREGGASKGSSLWNLLGPADESAPAQRRRHRR